jgi:hypothetical protein
VSRNRRPLIVTLAALAICLAGPAYALEAKPPARGFQRALSVVAGRVAQLDTSEHFNLVGLRWRGASGANVALRARVDGHWSAWVRVGHATSARRGRPTATDPVWVGEADALQVRSDRSLTGAVASFQNTTGTATAHDRVVTAVRHAASAVTRPLLGALRARPAEAAPGAPRILPRSSWNDGSCKPRAKPLYGSVRMAFVHHTVTLNDYSPEESASIVLAICRYHVDQSGWNDIGYNFLADKYGQLFEGRAGGTDKAVVGAQAQGWNSQSTSVSVLGTYTQTPLGEAGVNAVAGLLGWKLALHGVTPLGRVTLTSAGGSENRWSAGTRVTFNTIAGHRDGDSTSCPGDALYAQLPEIRRLAASATAGTPPDLGADRSAVAYRSTVMLRGVAHSGSQAPVRIRAKANGSWRTIAELTSHSDGTFAHRIRARRTELYQAIGPLGHSPVRRVQVRPRIAVIVRGARRAARLSYRASGVARIRLYTRAVPMKRTLIVRAERRGGGAWHTALRRRLRTRRGRLWTTFTLSRPGRYRLRVISRKDRRNAAGRSHPRYLVVER